MSNYCITYCIALILISSCNYQPSIAGTAIYNTIDACWRTDPDWASNRMKMAFCALGFGREAYGGQNRDYYVVSNSSDDPQNPSPGTLRYGAMRKSPTWIYFAHDLNITLKTDLYVSSFTTIDGRGASVAIGDGPCLVLRSVRHVIVHGLRLHKCNCSFDGDAITISDSRHVWIDHNTVSEADDSLIDVMHGSTNVTISNNYFFRQDRVIILRHDDTNCEDVHMRLTVAYNRFGAELGQSMPRCGHGYFHVVNNDYSDGWSKYAIGGSDAPTIISVGNRFKASIKKQITKREGCTKECKSWVWRSISDTFVNGSRFVETGSQPKSFIYDGISYNIEYEPYMTSSAGTLA